MLLHRFEDAAFLQETLLHDINRRGYFSRLCDGFQRSRYPELPPNLVRSITGHTLMRADPIYVSDDVMSLWEEASKTFKLEVVRRDDLVVPAGFALLPRPFSIIDMHGKTVKYRALAWLPVSLRDTYDWDAGVEGQGVWITMLSNINDIDDYWLESHQFEGMSGAEIRTATLTMGEEWTLMHGSPLQFDQAPGGVISAGDGDGKHIVTDPEEIEKASSIYGHVQCFWRLMNQLVMEPASLPRQARRQRQRAGMIDHVKVLKLRRSRPRHEGEWEGEGIEYSHRWVVEGHWRNQPYGPAGNKQYKQIWISPYVKGPDDKPLVVKKRGVEFSR
jgi:hypothetical protein